MSPDLVGYRTSLLPAKVSTFRSNRVEESSYLKQELNEKLFSSSKQLDTKANIVSESGNQENPNPQSDVRFQTNTPVANLLKVIKNFNETRKADLPEENENDESDIAEFEDIKATADEEKKDGIGFYIVLDDRPSNLQKKFPKTKYDLMREKIGVTYQSNFRKQPGRLVNLTV